MFPPIFDEADSRTPWQRFENLASKVMRTPKEAIDARKPLRPLQIKTGLTLTAPFRTVPDSHLHPSYRLARHT
jgi:hypothetical protein